MTVYAVYNDDHGHNLLIPVDEYKNFISEVNHLTCVIDSYYRHGSDESKEKAEGVVQELWNLLDNYDRLEGEDYYVILADEYNKEMGIVKETK